MSKLHPRDTVIIDAVRTAIGQPQGVLQHLNAEQLSAATLQQLIQRHEFDLNEIEDFIWGSADVISARRIALAAQLPVTVTGQVIQHLQGSSMQALHAAAAQIATEQGHIFIVGGVGVTPSQVMPSAPIAGYAHASFNPLYSDEFLAHLNQISREAQDQLALQSQQKAWLAQQRGHFQAEIVPIQGLSNHGFMTTCHTDELITQDLTFASLKTLPTIHQQHHATLTVGNTANQGIGASALLLMSAEHAQSLGLKPKAVIRAMAVAACDPAIASYATVPAIQKALKRAGRTIEEIHTFELDEHSAAAHLSIVKNLNLTQRQDRINMYGGAIALGQVMGSSGTQMLTTLLHIMEHKNTTLGLAALSMDLGQGIATVIERI